MKTILLLMVLSIGTVSTGFGISKIDSSSNRVISDNKFNAAKKTGSVTLTTALNAFSPNNDKIRDEETFSLEANPANSVSTWTFKIYRVTPVRELVFSTNGEKKIPKNIVWKGDYSDQTKKGLIAPDGKYESELTVTWSFKYSANVLGKEFLIDTLAPKVVVESPIQARSFSPNGDAIQDTFQITQKESSTEKLWQGLIKDKNGKSVKNLTWAGRAIDFVWDGFGADGKQVSDGDYFYEIIATDDAGNQGGAKIGPIIVDTANHDLALSALPAFSPNNDGKLDRMTFKASSSRSGTAKFYQLEILNTANAKVVTTQKGIDPFSESLIWDGSTGASKAPEGLYRARLSLEFESGLKSTSTSSDFKLLLTAPQAKVSLSTKVFSPDGDGRLDSVTFEQKAPPSIGTLDWVGEIRSKKGEVIKSWNWSSSLEPRIVWDGLDGKSSSWPDGDYTYLVSGTDEAQNTSQSVEVVTKLDARIPKASIKNKYPSFSPNNDKSKDLQTFALANSIVDGVETWEFSVIEARTKNPVFTAKGSGKNPPSIDWDGKSDAGAISADGDFETQLTLRYFKGNALSVSGSKFTVDTRPPSVTATIMTPIFSPEGDGHKDLALISQEDGSNETLWTGLITDSNKKQVRTFSWQGSPQGLSWDGKTDQGADASDGKYYYQISCQDEAGNKFNKSLGQIIIDRRPTGISFSDPMAGFNPKSADKSLSIIAIKPKLSLNEGIESYAFAVTDTSSKLAYQIKGKKNLAPAFQWNGSIKPTGLATDGKYFASFDIVYDKGNEIHVQSPEFLLDTSPPALEFTPGPLPFSPDGDGHADTLNLAFEVTDLSPITKWKLEILDPTGLSFYSLEAKDPPKQPFVWDGKNQNGELLQSAVTYAGIVTVIDSYGNKAVTQVKIPTDVFVLKDGNDLRIRLPGIEFAPGSDNLFDIEPEKAEANRQTLSRLIEILKTYENYSIVIEGHANSTKTKSGKTPNALEQKTDLLPLSEKRALAVKRALIEGGLNEERLLSKGVGGARPLVDFSDSKNYWKNRRVEFVLKKPQ